MESMRPNDRLSAPDRNDRPPLLELHLHLEGALTAGRALSLARGMQNVDPPPWGGIRTRDGEPVMLETAVPRGSGLRWSFRDLAGFLRLFGWSSRLLSSAAAYRALLGDLLESLERQGIVYAEVFVAFGQMHYAGIDPRDIVPELARVAADRAAAGGPDVRFIADATRQWGVRACERVLDAALDLQQHRIVGFGMGGDENGPRARDFKAVYRRALGAGLGLTCHAGEGTHPDAVREVVEELDVRRVGHGIAAVFDGQLLDELARERILLEVCPTSNLRTGVWTETQGRHPLHALVEHGVPVTLGSDDPAYFETDLAGEWQRALDWGWTSSELATWNRAAAAHVFRPEDERRALARRLGDPPT
jgi:adenosine deaminase